MTAHARRPLILYVPGLKPKPPRDEHAEQVRRCLVEGVRRIDADVASEMASDEDILHLVAWTYDFYGEHRDINLDLDDIETVIAKLAPTPADIATVTSLKRHLLRAAYRAADHLPFLIAPIANQDVEMQLRDLRRYARNDHGIADGVRAKLREPLVAAVEAGRPVLVYGHSMGSIICYDALWELSHGSGAAPRVDLFLTTGSPLGQRLIQRRLKGWRRKGRDRYPDNIECWRNVAAVGELTAIDMTLKNDFGEMVELDLVRDIEDYVVWNYYHMAGHLNVHTEYGYLVNEMVAKIVRDWWCEVTAA